MFFIWIIGLGWLYVALLMALAEAMHPAGGWLGAIFTFLLYGVAPLSLVMYLLRTPMRRQQQRERERAQERAQAAHGLSALQPDASGHAARDAIAAEGVEPVIADSAPTPAADVSQTDS